MGEFLVTRIFTYALFIFRLRGDARSSFILTLATQTSRLETLQKKERNSSISFCFSAKQLLSSNYLYFLDSGNFPCRIKLYSLDPRRLRGRLRGVCCKMKQNIYIYAYTPAYAPQQAAYIQPCAVQLSYVFLLVKKTLLICRYIYIYTVYICIMYKFNVFN